LTSDFLSADLFPELPKVVVPPPPRKRKLGAAKAAAKSPTVPSAQAQNLAGAGTFPAAHGVTDPEACAAALDAHPDFRVLRRLPVRLHWSDAPSMGRTRVLILDTETTGLDQSKEKIIELAMLRLEVDNASGQPLGLMQVFDELEDPGRAIPKEVVALTGITDADVQGKRLDEVRIAAMLDGVDLVIAHNAAFDRPFCEARMPQFRELAWACSFADIDWKGQGRSSSKLEALALELGWFYDAHRADMDCHALLAVLCAPLPKSPERNGLATLLAAARKPALRIYATHAPFDAKDLLKARGYRWNAEQKVWFSRIADEAALEAECEWLKTEVYGGRHAVVAIEQSDAHAKYSSRGGRVVQRQL
jgi:DNA polymerase III subunit epsilon